MVFDSNDGKFLKEVTIPGGVAGAMIELKGKLYYIGNDAMLYCISFD